MHSPHQRIVSGPGDPGANSKVPLGCLKRSAQVWLGAATNFVQKWPWGSLTALVHESAMSAFLDVDERLI